MLNVGGECYGSAIHVMCCNPAYKKANISSCTNNMQSYGSIDLIYRSLAG